MANKHDDLKDKNWFFVPQEDPDHSGFFWSNEETGQKVQALIGAMRAITTALLDTIEDPTLPNHLRKVQLGHLLEHVEELGLVVGK